MKLTETMSAENVATLRALFARCDKDLKHMDADARKYDPVGIYASNTYNTLFWFMVDVRDAYSKKYVVSCVLNDLNRAWNNREKWGKRYIESGNKEHLARFNAYTIEAITLQMLVGYVTR